MSDSPQLKRVAVISDLSGFGKCSLTVALPVISAAGVECACIPTALLSTHTGEFTGYTFRDLSSEMIPIANHWKKEGIKFDGIYSGYLASPEQAELLEETIDILRDDDTLVIVDPVMADNREFYPGFDERMCDAFRRLCRRADIITPNITEAALLTGLAYEEPPHTLDYIERLLDSLLSQGSGTVALTGVQMSLDQVGVAAKRETGITALAFRPAREGIFHGTGDLFASAFTALLVRGAELTIALETAVDFVGESIDRCIVRANPRKFGVDFESALSAYVTRIQGIFGESNSYQ